MSDPGEEPSPKTQPAASGRPSRQAKSTARDWEHQGDDRGRTIYLLDPVAVRDLASALQLKPFKVVADLMGLGLFKSPDETVDFETASRVARQHGYQAVRPPPGMLVL